MNPHRVTSCIPRRSWSAAAAAARCVHQPGPAFHSAAAAAANFKFNPSTSAPPLRTTIVLQAALPNTFTTQPHRNLHITTAKMSTAPDASAAQQLIEKSKFLAANRAVTEHLSPTYRHIGIGSGSTVIHVVDVISKLGTTITGPMTFYPTGDQSRDLIQAAGFRLGYLSDLSPGHALDVCFDGADEVDPALNLIKGGGACLLQEKLVATAARKFVCVADSRKISNHLGTQWKKGIPIEVFPMAVPQVLGELERLGRLSAQVRSGLPGKAGACVTDNGLRIVDAVFKPLLTELPEGKQEGEEGVWTVDGLARRLIEIPGVAEHGLFYGKSGLEVESGGAQKPVAAYFGMEDGSVMVQTLENGLVKA
ncbi:ribose 5-phosphate isomerase A, variant, partial [Neurospora crassa OR74A]